MTEEFNKWWDEDLLTENNPYVGGTPAYWAWEGWCAAVKAEREACAKVCEGYTDNSDADHESHGYACAAAIRGRGNT
jgi:hypothetical protein